MAGYRILFAIVALTVTISIAINLFQHRDRSEHAVDRSGLETAGYNVRDQQLLKPESTPHASSNATANTPVLTTSPGVLASGSNQNGTTDDLDDARVAVESRQISDADFQRHIAKLKTQLAGSDYSVVLQKPFVVIGNEDPAVVRQRATRTVKWAVDRLKKRYFKKDPNKIINIWLMKDKETYEQQCLEIVKYRPNTPYGFYSSTHNVLMMNISTGGGTLVHEIVHPFIEANFPNCPSWFNEGLASLYEQSSANPDDQIVGLTNWRLRGLQMAIKDQRVPTFKQLCSTTTEQFYRQDPGTNYSQARYLCYYLQEKGQLEQYYKQFVANQGDDRSGYETLKSVLETNDMSAFQSDWQDYVMKLRF